MYIHYILGCIQNTCIVKIITLKFVGPKCSYVLSTLINLTDKDGYCANQILWTRGIQGITPVQCQRLLLQVIEWSSFILPDIELYLQHPLMTHEVWWCINVWRKHTTTENGSWFYYDTLWSCLVLLLLFLFFFLTETIRTCLVRLFEMLLSKNKENKRNRLFGIVSMFLF